MPNPMLYTLDQPLTRAEVLDAFSATPSKLRSLLANVSEDRLLRARAEGDWPAFKVLLHLRDASLAYSSRFRWMVFNDNPNLPSFNENNWVVSAVDTAADIPSMLDFIEAARADLMRLLTRMPAESWQRTGQHEVAGEIVLEDYVRHQLAHELGHLTQIQSALGNATLGARS